VARTTRTRTFTPGRPRSTHPSCRADRTSHMSSGLRFMALPSYNPRVSSHHPGGKLTRSRGRQGPVHTGVVERRPHCRSLARFIPDRVSRAAIAGPRRRPAYQSSWTPT
jgi:hypothetical protein